MQFVRTMSRKTILISEAPEMTTEILASSSHGIVSIRQITRTPTRDEVEAENSDPYVMGWEAGADLDEPPGCPYKSGLSSKLWRKGFADRVEKYIAERRSKGGLSASLT